jgi:hypothetical protein
VELVRSTLTPNNAHASANSPFLPLSGLWFPATAQVEEKREGVSSKKWFLVSYDVLSMEHGKGVGRVELFDWANEKRRAASGNFSVMCMK